MQKCGSSVGANEHYCPVCGARIEEETNDVFSQQYTATSNEKPAYYNSTMVFGILSVVFSAINYLGVPFVHLVGIILGSIALQYAKRDKQSSGTFNSAGKILGIVGLTLGIIAIIVGVYYTTVYGTE